MIRRGLTAALWQGLRWLLGLARCPYRTPLCRGRDCYLCELDRARGEGA